MTSAMASYGQARKALFAIALLCSALPLASASAQRERDAETERTRRIGGVPREVTVEVTSIWNAPSTRRIRGDFTLAPTDTVRGDLAVLGGRTRLAGVVTGQVVVLNGDATLVNGARIERNLTVVGGTLESPDRPDVGGEIRVWSARYRYREDADSLVADTDFFGRWSRWTREDARGSSESDLFVTTAHTYNRVEGLPIYVGPRFRARSGDTRVRAELFGIFRTGDQLNWKRENLGHRVLLEVRQGNSTAIALGGRLFDEVDAVEKWQLSDTEIGLNTFLFSRDYRDYYQRHGGQGYVSLFAGRGSEIRASYGEERWTSRQARDVRTLFNSDVPFRANPLADEGVLNLFTLSATLDTRNSPKDPRSGWYLRGEYEHGDGELNRVTSGGSVFRVSDLSADVKYSRALLDLRRYNRLGPGASLNMRAVLGGWIDGDPLPSQRRLAVSGVDALPGFDFRRQLNDTDVGTCATGDESAYAVRGRPALCDRMALLQIEWKGDFRIGNHTDFGDSRWVFNRMNLDGTWIVFANSGRGWLVGPRNDGNLLYPKGSVPELKSWRTDLGGGLDFGNFGVYVAQAVSESGLSPNVYMRLSRRF